MVPFLGYLDRPVDAQERYIAAAFMKGTILFFRFHKVLFKTTEISHFFEEKIEKVGILL